MPEKIARISVVLVEPHHPGNIGSVARAMTNMGVSDLRLVNPCELTKESRYLAWRAVDIVEGARRFETLEEAVADCHQVVGFSAREGRFRNGPHALPLHAQEIASSAESTALVFGREDAGLRIDEYELCHSLVRIPTLGRSTSLNLAQAVMVALYEICGRPTATESAPQRAAPPTRHLFAEDDLDHVPTPPESLPRTIDAKAMEYLIEDWDQAARILGYDDFGPKDLMRRLMRRLRRILFRAELSREDADLLLGISRRIQGRYRVPGSRSNPGADSKPR